MPRDGSFAVENDSTLLFTAPAKKASVSLPKAGDDENFKIN